MVEVPHTTQDADAAFVTAALRESGVLSSGTSVAELEHDVIGEGVGIVGQLARLQLRYQGQAAGAPGTVILKIPSQYPENRAVGDHFNFYEREGRFYQQLADKVPLRTAQLLLEPRRPRHRLLRPAAGGPRRPDDDQPDRRRVGATRRRGPAGAGQAARRVVELTGARRARLDAPPRRSGEPRGRSAVPRRLAHVRRAHRRLRATRGDRARRADPDGVRGRAPPGRRGGTADRVPRRLPGRQPHVRRPGRHG